MKPPTFSKSQHIYIQGLLDHVLTIVDEQYREICFLKKELKWAFSQMEKVKEKYRPTEKQFLLELRGLLPNDENIVLYPREDILLSEKEKRQLKVQAVGLALCILSRNKIGIEDICRHEAMIELNPYYFSKMTSNKRLNTPKDLLREIVPPRARGKGKKKKGYFTLHPERGGRNGDFCHETRSYYETNHPLPNVYDRKEGKIYLDVSRIHFVISTWWEMVKNDHITEGFFHNNLCLTYFNDCTYPLGCIYPGSIFGEFLAKRMY